MFVNIIKREVYPQLFEKILEDDCVECSYYEHRRASNFYCRKIYQITEKYCPDFPELWGFWETNTYIDDSEHGCDWDEVRELVRVEKVEKVVTTTEWIKV